MSTTQSPAGLLEGSVSEKPIDADEAWVQVDGQWVPDYESTMVDFTEQDIVTGIVVRVDNDEVLVDIGYKSEGVIPARELSIRRNVDPHDEVAVGEEIEALVLDKEDSDGRLIMSKKRARFEKAWKRIEAHAEAGDTIRGNVIEVVKGGLILDLGIRGFLPASLVDIRRVQNLDEFMGTEIECKVIELNRQRNNVVLSRRSVLEEERREVRQRILDTLNVGDVVEGTISNIVDFGAFVDLDGIDGLIHISELSWSHVNHPAEVVEIGQTVQVKVLDIERDRQRISLGLKQTSEDPWQKVLSEHKVGDIIEGTVTKVVTFGAFVELQAGVEGLVHISELSWEHVENPREVVNPGDKVKTQLVEIEPDRRRISLSIKRTTEPPAEVTDPVEDYVPIDASGEGLDLGDTNVGAALREAARRARGDEDGEADDDVAAGEAEETPEADAAGADSEEPAAAEEEAAPAAEPEAEADAATADEPAADEPAASSDEASGDEDGDADSK